MIQKSFLISVLSLVLSEEFNLTEYLNNLNSSRLVDINSTYTENSKSNYRDKDWKEFFDLKKYTELYSDYEKVPKSDNLTSPSRNYFDKPTKKDEDLRSFYNTKPTPGYSSNYAKATVDADKDFYSKYNIDNGIETWKELCTCKRYPKQRNFRRSDYYLKDDKGNYSKFDFTDFLTLNDKEDYKNLGGTEPNYSSSSYSSYYPQYSSKKDEKSYSKPFYKSDFNPDERLNYHNPKYSDDYIPKFNPYYPEPNYKPDHKPRIGSYYPEPNYSSQYDTYYPKPSSTYYPNYGYNSDYRPQHSSYYPEPSGTYYPNYGYNSDYRPQRSSYYPEPSSTYYGFKPDYNSRHSSYYPEPSHKPDYESKYNSYHPEYDYRHRYPSSSRHPSYDYNTPKKNYDRQKYEQHCTCERYFDDSRP